MKTTPPNAQTAKPPQPISYAQEFRSFVRKNAPADFEAKFTKARPFILTSFAAWPMYWLYRGFEWTNHRHADRLQTYINRTYLQAKMIQICIIAAGIYFASSSIKQPNSMQNLSNVAKKDYVPVRDEDMGDH